MCQCSSMPPASAHQCHISATFQCLTVYINATYKCPSELPFSVTQQCQSVPPINAMPISAAYQCHQCCLSVPVSATYQCHI
ncbi:unnamed protein product [Staurois parvus]|uniref:Uncharacterized protein n=1 Tax=Staurois parvus TaxID=386267 RepID=A0ABN9GE47_9NEOB|nr:unnamed protein product [Staurois parvus]